MVQGAVTGVTGAATSAISRKNNWGWWGGNNNGAQTAAATGATQRTDRNSQAVASTTATSQTVGVDAYQQCVNGIKGPEYIHFRQTGQIVDGSTPASATVAAAATAPVAHRRQLLQNLPFRMKATARTSSSPPRPDRCPRGHPNRRQQKLIS
jgi:hypothetical protein